METFFTLLVLCEGNPPVTPHKGQWRRALMFSLISAWINGWANNQDAGDLRCHLTHYDVTVMLTHIQLALSIRLCETYRSSGHDWWKSRRTMENMGGLIKLFDIIMFEILENCQKCILRSVKHDKFSQCLQHNSVLNKYAYSIAIT